MSTNDGSIFDKNEHTYFDQTDAASENEGELTQDELNNVSGGLRDKSQGRVERLAGAADPSDMLANRVVDKDDSAA